MTGGPIEEVFGTDLLELTREVFGESIQQHSLRGNKLAFVGADLLSNFGGMLLAELPT